MAIDPVRILAVDDVEENLTALEALLRADGVELVKARSGFQALELLLKGTYALALLDVQMPGMDGFELAELMRGTERTRGVPIIFLTALATDEKRRFRGFEAGAVDYLLKPLDPQVLVSKVAVFCELARQRQELARQRDELGAALSRLRAHGDNSPLAVIELDAGLRVVTWTGGAERMLGFGEMDVLGQHLEDVAWIPEEDRGAFVRQIAAMIHGDDTRAIQHHRLIHFDGTVIEGECYCSSLSGTGGRAGTVVMQVLDITERRRAEETQALLIGELNHRVKNSLATVQAIASQSLRHADSREDFRQTFMGRLQALSRAHSLLSAATWEGARMMELVGEQVAMGAVGADKLVLDGPDIHLPPELALRFALVLHELATNANKYGALSVEDGRVALSWSADGGMLDLEWHESGGPKVAPPTREGFGTRLIETSLVADGGTVRADYRPEGVVWTLRVPLNGDGVMPLSDEVGVAGTGPMPSSGREDKPPMAGPAPAAHDPIAGQRVLVVEDEPLVAMELEMVLEEAGTVPLGPASTCAQAIDAIAAERPDVVLLDGNLNGERVDAVVEALVRSAVPFAFVSGYGAEHLPQGAGERPIISKPFVASQLLEVIRALAEQRQAEGAPVTD